MAYVTPAAALALGATFVCRYLSTLDAPRWKVLATAREVADLNAAGVSFVFNYEDLNKGPGDGFARGVAAALVSQGLLDVMSRDIPGVDKAPVIFSFADTSIYDTPALLDAMRGAASVIGLARTGGYGGLAAVKSMLDAGVITFAWQTVAWSHGEWDPRAQLRQDGSGKNVINHDDDLALFPDFGQWPRP